MYTIFSVSFRKGDIYEETTPDIEKLGLECECVGGGRIKHDPSGKTIHVYGYSQVSIYFINIKSKQGMQQYNLNKIYRMIIITLSIKIEFKEKFSNFYLF